MLQFIKNDFCNIQNRPQLFKRFGANLEILFQNLYCNHLIMCQNWKQQKDCRTLIKVLNGNKLHSDLCQLNDYCLWLKRLPKNDLQVVQNMILLWWTGHHTGLPWLDEFLVKICPQGWQSCFSVHFPNLSERMTVFFSA